MIDGTPVGRVRSSCAEVWYEDLGPVLDQIWIATSSASLCKRKSPGRFQSGQQVGGRPWRKLPTRDFIMGSLVGPYNSALHLRLRSPTRTGTISQASQLFAAYKPGAPSWTAAALTPSGRSWADRRREPEALFPSGPGMIWFQEPPPSRQPSIESSRPGHTSSQGDGCKQGDSKLHRLRKTARSPVPRAS